MQQCIMTTSCLHVAKGMCNIHRYSKTKLQYPRMILERYSNGVYKEPYFPISSNIGTNLLCFTAHQGSEMISVLMESQSLRGWLHSLGGWEPKFNCFIFFVNYLEGRSPMDKTSRCSTAVPPVWPTPFQPHLDSRALKEHNFLLWTSMHKLFAWSYHDQFIISWKKSKILGAKRRRKIYKEHDTFVGFFGNP